MAKEKRLIDANEALRMIENSRTDNPYFNGKTTPIWEKAHDCALSCVIACPAVDAVEVVRCKDCKHWHEETGWCDNHSWFIEEDGEPCHPWESNNWKMLMEDDFCSYGERKDNA